MITLATNRTTHGEASEFSRDNLAMQHAWAMPGLRLVVNCDHVSTYATHMAQMSWAQIMQSAPQPLSARAPTHHGHQISSSAAPLSVLLLASASKSQSLDQHNGIPVLHASGTASKN